MKLIQPFNRRLTGLFYPPAVHRKTLRSCDSGSPDFRALAAVVILVVASCALWHAGRTEGVAYC